MKKLNKEFNMEWCPEIATKMGTINKDNPQVIYICGRTWLMPSDEDNFPGDMSRIKHRFSRTLSSILSSSDFFHTKTVLDFGVNTENLMLKKKKFLSFEFFVKQKGRLPLKEIRDAVRTTFRPLILELNENLQELDIESTPKKNN